MAEQMTLPVRLESDGQLRLFRFPSSPKLMGNYTNWITIQEAHGT